MPLKLDKTGKLKWSLGTGLVVCAFVTREGYVLAILLMPSIGSHGFLEISLVFPSGLEDQA